ncbi:MAG TPA: hypothetical protein VM286_03390 [Candidatus Thermoplasmatota archaeon]|nr:hypothetical protein [Candidatus Thermoplasmatota archaeon]
MRLLAVTLLLAAMLAGCSHPFTAGPSTLTAREGLAPAVAAARVWNPQARLVSVGGAEMADAEGYLKALETLGTDRRQLEEQGSPQLLPANDHDIADGRLPAWGYTFGRDGPGQLRIIVDATGKVTFNHNTTGNARDYPDLANDTRWKVDSDHVNDIFAGNESLQKIRSSSNGVLTYTLTATSTANNLRWLVSGGEHGVLNTTFTARVSALNGTVAPLKAPVLVPPAPKLPPIEAGMASGTATLNADTVAPFSLGSHGSVKFLLRVPGNTVPGSLRAVVERPDDGQTVLQVNAFLPGTGGDDTASAEEQPAGDYKATFHVNSGVTEDYTFYWCTDGSGAPPDNPAC